jgi:peptide methionine sulfoxide reductase MsrA
MHCLAGPTRPCRSPNRTSSTVTRWSARGPTAPTLQERLNEAGYGEITTEIGPIELATGFFYAEPYHQQYLAQNPNGYCVSAAPA